MVSGPSGSGKTTISKAILERFENLDFSISATTRPIRKNEINGKDYYFLSKKEFNTKLKNNELVEYQEVYPGLFYGTLKSEVERIIRNKKIALLDVDVKGAMNIKKIYTGEAFTIFVHPGRVENLKERLKNRKSEDELSLETRLKRAALELGFAKEFDAVIHNDDSIENAINETERIIDALTGKS